MAKPKDSTTEAKRKRWERLRRKNADKPGNITDRTLWCRHEIKYIINESIAAAIVEFIKPYMQPDRYCMSQPRGRYPIVSLYLDSRNLQLYRESLQGLKNRFKLRIRSYTDEPDYPRFFEIKRRAGSIIIKSRTQVLHEQLMPLLSGSAWPLCTNDGELRQFLLYMNSIGARPTVRIRYMRQAFEGTLDKRVRITFDRDLCYNITRKADVSLNGRAWQLMHKNRVILEIKFTGRYPVWIDRMVKHFGLRQQSVSKYASSIKQASLLRFCAPKISENGL